MKTIKNIDERPPHFDDEVPADELLKIPTYRKFFRSAIGMGLAKDGDSAMDLIQIGLKLRVEGNDVTLEDAEFKALKERCERNTPQWAAHFHGHILLKLKESEHGK